MFAPLILLFIFLAIMGVVLVGFGLQICIEHRHLKREGEVVKFLSGASIILSALLVEVNLGINFVILYFIWE